MSFSSWTREKYLDLPREKRAAYLQEGALHESGALLSAMDVDVIGDDIVLARAFREDTLMLLRGDGNLSTTTEDTSALVQELSRNALKSLTEHFSPQNVLLKRVTTSVCSDATLGRIARAEAVLSQDVNDLKRRLEGARRVYGLFHKQDSHMEDPVAFIHVALAPEFGSSIEEIMHLTPDAERRTATFYSVNVPSASMTGLDLGRRLIHALSGHLLDEISDQLGLATLSPLPGLRQYVEGSIDRHEADDAYTLNTLQKNPHWRNDADLEQHCESWLSHQAARYLVLAKAPPRNDGAPPAVLDPVLRFHLRNGAKACYRINPHGSASDVNMRKSFGVLVNYLYAGGAVVDEDIRVVKGVPVSANVAHQLCKVL